MILHLILFNKCYLCSGMSKARSELIFKLRYTKSDGILLIYDRSVILTKCVGSQTNLDENVDTHTPPVVT